MTKLRLSPYLAFEVEKFLIGLHPNAEYIRVNCDDKGLIANVEENGIHIDVTGEMVAYVNSKIRESQ